ncbi:MAG TPA: hypothetical protein DCS43_02050 [Verrucomicrobia bacterium]|nr:hypothetical protein [Verrucomicrobiota bacterium]
MSVQGHNTGGRQAGIKGRYVLLAWAGWRLEMPEAWQPLKISGTSRKGQMIVGDTECAMFSIQWERTRPMTVAAGSDWVSGRLTKLGVLADANPPAKDHFTACGWATAVQTEEDKQTTHWFGYAEPAGLLLAVTVNGVLSSKLRTTLTGGVFPSLRTTAINAPGIWAMYDVSFEVPAGFELEHKHLYSGDLALNFTRGLRETLLLRQVYPGDLALGRRPFERWLQSSPFKEHRRLRRRSVTITPWNHASGSLLNGVRRVGCKRLGMPLGWCAPRWSCAMAVQDSAKNRLLMVEHQSADRADETLCVQAIERMNKHVAEERMG